MKKIVTMGLAVSLILGSSSALAETTNTTQVAHLEVATKVKNKLSKHVYLIGIDDKDPNAVLRFEDESFPLRPEVTVAIDGNIVDYGKYKPVNTISGSAAIPLLQTLKAAGITYSVEGNFYVFSYNGVTYKVPFDGSRIMQIIKDGKVQNTWDTLASQSWVVDNEMYVTPGVFEVIFFNEDHSKDDVMISVDRTVDGKKIHETMTQKEYNERFNVVQHDESAYSERPRVLNLYSKIDPIKEKDKANEALRKVIDTLPPEYFLEMRMPENEKAVMKSKATEITKGLPSNYDKVKAIHQWVARNLTYDMDVYHNNYKYINQISTTGISNAYKTLERMRDICGGYAELENQLLKAIGIPARTVLVDADHIWVDAYVGDKWISTDPTWDTTDAIVNGERVQGYFKRTNSDNTRYFDFAFSDRSLWGNFIYLLDDYGTHEEFDTYNYAKWFLNSPYASHNNDTTVKETNSVSEPTVKDKTTEKETAKNKSIPDPRPISIPSGAFDSSGKFTPRKPYTKDNVGVGINGKLVNVNPPARMINDSTFIPLRGVFEAIGAKVTWEGEKRSIGVVKGDITVRLTVDDKTAYVNGEPVTLSTAPFISDEGSTFVPLRFISETIGAKIGWDAENFVALIVTKPY